MVKARVVVQKLGRQSLEKDVKDFILPLSENQLFQLSEETVNEIRERIRRTIIREGSTGNLASSFFAEKITEGYGIGNIDYLNQHAPYWHWQNYGIAQSGRRTPPSTIGHFDGVPEYPSSSAIKNQRWIHESSEKGYLMNPTKPIIAKNYIEQTFIRIPDITNRILNQVK